MKTLRLDLQHAHVGLIDVNVLAACRGYPHESGVISPISSSCSFASPSNAEAQQVTADANVNFSFLDKIAGSASECTVITVGCSIPELMLALEDCEGRLLLVVIVGKALSQPAERLVACLAGGELLALPIGACLHG